MMWIEKNIFTMRGDIVRLGVPTEVEAIEITADFPYNDAVNTEIVNSDGSVTKNVWEFSISAAHVGERIVTAKKVNGFVTPIPSQTVAKWLAAWETKNETTLSSIQKSREKMIESAKNTTEDDGFLTDDDFRTGLPL